MPDESYDQHDSVGAWAKQFHFASRALIEATLREHGLGPTQWYVLHQLVNEGATSQRELGVALKVERATMSGVVSTLVRKGLVVQVPDVADQRQRILSVTATGRELWAGLPDPVALTTAVSFDGADPADLAVARRVLKTATERLLAHMAAEDPET
ncbi:MarR family transcriptional regulator [Subtercola boreus]|uniref:MarR family transcriptional regulator n=1 Tax=Subtercola boreus TaxID=120213 RepID=A0A3E0VJS0_9MICO|nr:MarR family transcriptional regulator [Subtercola boreus]RFA09738.1 MarR family transcriptional regulator [Subtercola boreus]TQL53155.1 DNA-binding MarR family transcriptional regulator [Subtercola boreus]